MKSRGNLDKIKIGIKLQLHYQIGIYNSKNKIEKMVLMTKQAMH
jgi:hypothetical protein